MILSNLKKIDNLVFAILFLIFAFHILRHVNDFYVPESDFFDYRQKAIELRHFQWPENFKRPPLYSSLIAIASVPIPGKYRELYAAEFIGVLSVFFSFVLVYKIAAHFFHQHAFWALWLWAMHPTTLRMAIKPKPEILVTVLILWAFERFIRGDRKAYLVAFFATLVRYEGAIAILAFFVSDFFLTKEKLKSILYAFFSGIFIVLWTVLHSKGEDGGSYTNYYNSYHPNFAFLKTFWVGVVGFLPVQLFRFWTLTGIGLLASGIVYGYKFFRRETVALLTFLLGFIAMHIIWPFSNIDYIVIIFWNAIILILLGIKSIAVLTEKYPRLRENVVKLWMRKTTLVVTSFIALIIIMWTFRTKFPFSQYNVHWLVVLAFMVPAFMVIHRQTMPVALKVSFFALCWVLVFFLNSKTNADFFDIHYSKAEFRLTGEWFDQNRLPAEKMVAAQPIVVSYYTSLDPERDFIRLVDVPAASPAEMAQWIAEHGGKYIAWFSTNRVHEGGDAWYSWKRDNRGWRTIAFLQRGKSVDGFELVKEIRCGPRWAYIYRVVANKNG